MTHHSHKLVTEIILWTALVVVIVYDLIAYHLGWFMVTEGIREADRNSGMLVRWLTLAVWLHCFLLYWSR